MKFIKIFLIYFLGLITGVVFSSWLVKYFQAIKSPVSPTLAQTKDFILPVSEGQVLGAFAKNSNSSSDTNNNSNDVNYNEGGKQKDMGKDDKPKNSQLASLINQTMVDSNDDVKEEKQESEAVVQVKDKVEPDNNSGYTGQIAVAVVGDSMTDLMGPNLPYLKAELEKYYPKAQFNLLNYGVGAENIEKGLARIKGEYDYQDRHYSALAQVNPDIVVIESFAYNPFEDSSGELIRHWSGLVAMVDFVKANTKAQIIIMATIAPTKAQFGQGPNGVNWPADLAWQQAERINGLLENTVVFSQKANLPLVDVYHQTLLADGEGNLAYINSGDHIHQNETGNNLIARLLAEKIFSLGIFK